MTVEIFIGLHHSKKRKFILNRSNPISLGNAGLIKSLICEQMEQKVSDIEGHDRRREICIVRQICMYFIDKKTELTLLKIGSMFGNRDHSTVIYAKETVNDLMDTDKKFKAQITALDKLLDAELKQLNIPD